jgi:hypothetical protein
MYVNAVERNEAARSTRLHRDLQQLLQQQHLQDLK